MNYHTAVESLCISGTMTKQFLMQQLFNCIFKFMLYKGINYIQHK